MFANVHCKRHPERVGGRVRGLEGDTKIEHNLVTSQPVAYLSNSQAGMAPSPGSFGTWTGGHG